MSNSGRSFTLDDLQRAKVVIKELFTPKEITGLFTEEDMKSIEAGTHFQATFTEEEIFLREFAQLVQEFIPRDKLEAFFENEDRREAQQTPERPDASSNVA